MLFNMLRGIGYFFKFYSGIDRLCIGVVIMFACAGLLFVCIKMEIEYLYFIYMC